MASSNFCTKPISVSFDNFSVLEGDNNSLHKRSFNLEFVLSDDFECLAYQAVTFADCFQTHNEFNHSKIMRIRTNEVNRKLKELFIYDRVKNIHNAIFRMFLPRDINEGYSFRGNLELSRLICQGYGQKNLHDVFFSWRFIPMTENEGKVFIKRMMLRFPFLKKFLTETNGTIGAEPFIIYEYEAYMNSYHQDFYSKDNVNPGEISENPTPDPNNKGQAPNYNLGKLSIVEGVKSTTTEVTDSFEKCPLMNSFLSQDSKTLIFIPSANGHGVEFNRSFNYSKTFGIRIADSMDESDLVNKYYRSIKLDATQMAVLVGTEVYTTTGIKARGNELKFRNMTKFRLPNMEDLTKLFLEYSGDLGVSEILDELTKISLNDEIDDISGEILKVFNLGK